MGFTGVGPSATLAAVARGLAFPHAAQAIQIVRRRKLRHKWSRETCYAVTSFTILRLTGAASIAAALRYHARQSSRPLRTIMTC